MKKGEILKMVRDMQLLALRKNAELDQALDTIDSLKAQADEDTDQIAELEDLLTAYSSQLRTIHKDIESTDIEIIGDYLNIYDTLELAHKECPNCAARFITANTGIDVESVMEILEVLIAGSDADESSEFGGHPEEQE